MSLIKKYGIVTKRENAITHQFEYDLDRERHNEEIFLNLFKTNTTDTTDWKKLREELDMDDQAYDLEVINRNIMNEVKTIDICTDYLIPALAEEVKKWDGKVVDRRFYAALKKVGNEVLKEQDVKTRRTVSGYATVTCSESYHLTIGIWGTYDIDIFDCYAERNGNYPCYKYEDGKKTRVDAEKFIAKFSTEYLKRRRANILKTVDKKEEIIQAMDKIDEMKKFLREFNYDTIEKLLAHDCHSIRNYL